MTTICHDIVTDAQIEQFHEEGYFILEEVVPASDLAMLREECERYIELMHEEMDRLGQDVLGINHRNSRYFISNRYRQSQRMREFIFGDLMAHITRVTLGENVYLFNEQYVVKAAEKGMKFGWHQDSGYVGYDHKPYLTNWIPLDDVTEENGTVSLLPYSRAGTREWVRHTREEGTNDMIGYRGDDPGIPVIAPAGSIAVFSSTVFHRSGPNLTNQMRRVYLPQYTAEPLLRPDGQLWGYADPLWRDGHRRSL